MTILVSRLEGEVSGIILSKSRGKNEEPRITKTILKKQEQGRETLYCIQTCSAKLQSLMKCVLA